MSSPVYAAATARADKLLEPDGSIVTSTGTVVSGPNPTLAQDYANATARADKLLKPDGSITTSSTGGGSGTPAGTSGQVQYNSSGAFAGAAGLVTDGTNVGVGGITATLTNPFEVGSGANAYFQVTPPTGGTFTAGTTLRAGSTGASIALTFGGNALIAGPNGGNINIGSSGGGQSITFSVNQSNVNNFTFTGAASTAAPNISATGSDANINIKLTPKGTGSVQSTGPVITGVYTVATLPAATAALQGARALVTDATSPTFLGTLTGGSNVICPVFCTGSAWLAG